MSLGPLEPFLQLSFGLLHELECLRAVAVVMMRRLLELLLRPLQITRGREHVGMASGLRTWLILWRRRRRAGRRRLRRDCGGDEHGSKRQSGNPKLSSHAMASCALQYSGGA